MFSVFGVSMAKTENPVNLVTPAFYTVFTLTSLTIAKEYQIVYTLQSLLASEVSLVCAKIDILSD